MRNLGSKETLGLKFKDGVCAEFYLKLWFESNFVILLRQDGFESNFPKTKFQTITCLTQFEKVAIHCGTLDNYFQSND